ncbi:hypothetical protein [Brevundimonas diminuta]|uniref:tetratricopeptide repeat protein n=1 Tax=Brevundimonas diminuta TaxID=293 RepID=UPI0030F63AC0
MGLYYYNRTIGLIDRATSNTPLSVRQISGRSGFIRALFNQERDQQLRNYLSTRNFEERSQEYAFRAPEYYAEAADWFERAAKGGHLAAANRLGEMYAFGEGVEQNLDVAHYWWSRGRSGGASPKLDAPPTPAWFDDEDHTVWAAAYAGEASAQYELARLYSERARQATIDSATDDALKRAEDRETGPSALRWLRRAAEQGLAVAQMYVAEAYRTGSGPYEGLYYLERNYAEAEKYYTLVAEQGHVGGQVRLAELLMFHGYNGRRDGQALAWLQRAERTAERGQALARVHFRLGELYENGRGADQNMEQARRYYRLAAQGGNNAAERALQRLERELEGDGPTDSGLSS